MEPAPAQRKPIVTANQVTFLRLLSMPVMVWLFYQGRTGQWAALGVGSVIALTDYVDGMLARKYGGTRLGALMDPIADKVFLAVIILPPVDLGWFPPWLMAILFARELLITALRTAYERRGISLKTSYFAKVKTWMQMQGIAMMIAYVLIADRQIVWVFLLGGTGASLLAFAIGSLVARRARRGALIMFGCFLLLDALFLPRELETTLWLMSLGLVIATWGAGVDYLVSGLRQLAGRGDFDRADFVRVLASVLLPFAVVAALVLTNAPMWAVVSVLAIELAIGGLDNLLGRTQDHAGALVWSVRSLGAVALLAATVWLHREGRPALVDAAAVTAFALTLLGGAREFWRGRSFYL